MAAKTYRPMTQVPPKSLDDAVDYLHHGGSLVIPTHTRMTIITAKFFAKWEAQRPGEWFLKEEGDGYRMRQGKGSIYLLPGQLRFA